MGFDEDVLVQTPDLSSLMQNITADKIVRRNQKPAMVQTQTGTH